MPEQRTMSRRDWFRLHAARKNTTLGQVTSNTGNNLLNPIGQPPNHDGLDLNTLPPLREATLTLQDLDSLFADIEQLASDVTFMKRGNGNARDCASLMDSSSRFEMARTALVTGGTGRIQIRYRWENSLWIDTLEKHDNGFRIVRISHPQA